MLALMVFLAAAMLAFGVMAACACAARSSAAPPALREYGRARRRAASARCAHSSIKAAQRLLDYTTKHYSADDSEDMKVLRRRLIQAGIFDPRAVAYFFLARTVLAVGLGVGAFVLLPMLITQKPLDASG